jgi:hypothetical protein
MSKPTDEFAPTKDAATKVSKQVDALQGELQKKLEYQGVLLRVEKLRTEIGIAKSDIETIKTLARARGEERNVDDLLRLLKEKQRELEELEAKYEIPSEDSQHKRWWKFW